MRKNCVIDWLEENRIIEIICVEGEKNGRQLICNGRP